MTDEQLDELHAVNSELAEEIQAYRAFQTAKRLAEISNPGTIQDVVDRADREKNTPETARSHHPNPGQDTDYER